MLRGQAGILNEVHNVRVECNKDHTDRMTAEIGGSFRGPQTGPSSGRRGRATSVPDGRSTRAVSRSLTVRAGGCTSGQGLPAQPSDG
jgi:hypothetical protein